jgi:hypothetical protein
MLCLLLLFVHAYFGKTLHASRNKRREQNISRVSIGFVASKKVVHHAKQNSMHHEKILPGAPLFYPSLDEQRRKRKENGKKECKRALT